MKPDIPTLHKPDILILQRHFLPKLLTTLLASPSITPGSMIRFVKYRLVPLLVGLVFLACSTIALAHGHSDTKSADESHCQLCLVAHTVAHVFWCPPVVLHVAQVEAALQINVSPVFASSQELTPAQGRAPPVAV